MKKIELLNSKNYEVFKENELLIEDDSPNDIFIEINSAIETLKSLYCKERFNNKIIFDKVHIYNTQNTFIYDIFSETNIIDISKKLLENKV